MWKEGEGLGVVEVWVIEVEARGVIGRFEGLIEASDGIEGRGRGLE